MRSHRISMQSQSHSRRALRHTTILDLVETVVVKSQADLKHLLEARGHDVNQATLSRDLRELGLAKGPSGYRLPPGATSDELGQHLSQYLLEAITAQNQVVLKTPIGGASRWRSRSTRRSCPSASGPSPATTRSS